MGKPFDEYDYDDAAALVGPKTPTNPTLATQLTITSTRRPLTAISATRFLEGDHWQDSNGFIGQLPPAGFPDAATILLHIKQRFDSENVIKEVVETHRDGVLGREPLWSFIKEQTSAQAEGRKKEFQVKDPVKELLTPWWNERQALKNLQKTIDTCLCEEKAVIRLFFPRGRVPDSSELTAFNVSQALDYIYFETLTADVAGVFTDDDTQYQIGVYLFDERDEDGNVTDQCAGLTYLDQAGNTVYRVVKDKGDDEDYGPYKLGGHLLLHEVSRSQLITEQVQSNQKGLNFAKTMMLRNVNMAGSRERTVSNTQPPGKPVKIADPEDPSKTIMRHDGKYQVGAGSVMFLMGYPIWSEGKDGSLHVSGYTNPTVDRADPSPVNIFIETADDERTAVLRQCHQLHTKIAGDAMASGVSRQQAEKGWQRSLKESKTVLDAAGRWKLETTLRLAAQLCNQSAKYAQLRADFNCLLDIGDPEPDYVRMVMEMRALGGPNNQPLISDETARQKVGIEDPAAELARIEEEAPKEPVVDPNQPPQQLGDKEQSIA